MNDDMTHFGYQRVTPADKTARVGRVFDSVADRYDLMNDLMSFGLHRLWKHQLVYLSGLRRGQAVLDVAAGTGDLSLLLRRRTGAQGHVCMLDLNAAMLDKGRDKMINHGIVSGVSYVRATAEDLPFLDHSFDCVCIAFGLRNVADQAAALSSIYAKLRYGACLLVLEFSKVESALLDQLYRLYSFKIIPRIGRVVAADEDSYRYLVESIRMHPDQEALTGMLRAAGFGKVEYHNLSGGIVAIHRAWKL